MSELRPEPLFGISLDPAAGDPAETFRRAQIADENGLDLIALMDHPYNGRLFETWTLMTTLAARTERVRLVGDVFNLPLRPPAMLAKMAATLDVLSGGRLDLGLGAGAFWDGVVAYGGPRRTPGEAVEAFEEALHILRGMWQNAGGSFNFEGEFYQVKGARPGPAPLQPIPIWVGGRGPRMLRLTGRLADGLLVSHNYVPPQKMAEVNALVDEGAQAAGRSPDEIRRGYNLMGVIATGADDSALAEYRMQDEYVTGTVREWVDKICRWIEDNRQDTFIFWPVAGDQRQQMEIFAKEVVPAVKEGLG